MSKKSLSKILLLGISVVLFIVLAVPIFLVCCGIVWVLAFLLGYTYEEMNTFLFLYGQPIILSLTSLIGIFYIIIRLFQKFSWGKLVGLFFYGGIFLMHLPLLNWVRNRYWVMKAHNACLLAYKDLKIAGGSTIEGYIWANLLIFIIGFLVIFGINISPFWIFKKKKPTL